MLILSFS